MNQFTPTKQITKLDYFGQPYTATVIDDRSPDLGKLWASFTKGRYGGRGPGHQPVSQAWYGREVEKELKEKEY